MRIRFVLPGAATGKDPLTSCFAIVRLATQSVSKGNMFGDSQVGHDGIETIVKILVARVRRNRRYPILPYWASEAPVRRASQVTPNQLSRTLKPACAKRLQIIRAEIESRVAQVHHVRPL